MIPTTALSAMRSLSALFAAWLVLCCTVASASTSYAVSEDLWLSPLHEPLQISRFFDLPNGKYQAGHRGIDLPATAEQAVRAPAAGTISYVGVVAEKPVLTIRVSATTLLSFEPIVSDLVIGESVARGQVIGTVGTVGTNGHCETTCLHLGVRVNDEYVNPLRYFWPKPVLLPW